MKVPADAEEEGQEQLSTRRQRLQLDLREAAERADADGVRAALHEGANPRLLPEQLGATVEAIQRRFGADSTPGIVEFGEEEASSVATTPNSPAEEIQQRLRDAAERADADGVRAALHEGANPRLLPEQLAATVEAIQRRVAVEDGEKWSDQIARSKARVIDITR